MVVGNITVCYDFAYEFCGCWFENRITSLKLLSAASTSTLAKKIYFYLNYYQTFTFI